MLTTSLRQSPLRVYGLRLLLAALALTSLAAAAPAFGQSYTVQGMFWVDANNDGIRQDSEGTLPLTRISLMYVGADGVAYTGDDQRIDDTTVSSGGFNTPAGMFRFENGGGSETYYLAVIGSNRPSGYQPTLTGQGTPATDSNLTARNDVNAWVTGTFTINDGQLVTGFDLGVASVEQIERPFKVALPLVKR